MSKPSATTIALGIFMTLEKYLFSPLMKGESYEEANRKVCDQEFTVSEIRVSTNDGILSSMQYELDDNQEDN